MSRTWEVLLHNNVIRSFIYGLSGKNAKRFQKTKVLIVIKFSSCLNWSLWEKKIVCYVRSSDPLWPMTYFYIVYRNKTPAFLDDVIGPEYNL